MIVFWLTVALFLVGALLLVLPSLWSRKPASLAGASAGANVAVYRDQLREAERDLAADLITPERFEQAKAEIERRVLEDTAAAAADARTNAQPSRATAVVLAIVIPLASVLTYLALGEPDAAAPGAVQASGGAGDGRHELSGEQIQRMVAALAERLKNEPNNVDGWLMLARSYTAMSRFRDAAMAFRKASELVPDNADVLADLADVLGMAQGRRLAGEPARYIQRALDIDPRHVKALALAGTVAFEQKDYANARAYWERLIAVLPPDSELTRSIRGSIAEATQLESGGGRAPGSPTATAAAAPSPPASGPASIAAAPGLSGRVELSPQLAARVAAGDTLFVYARAAEGPRMPLAIVRRAATELPYAFKLDDSMAMAPNFKISGFQKVMVEARISRSGQAAAQSGDLIGQVGPVSPGSDGLRVLIDKVQP